MVEIARSVFAGSLRNLAEIETPQDTTGLPEKKGQLHENMTAQWPSHRKKILEKVNKSELQLMLRYDFEQEDCGTLSFSAESWFNGYGCRLAHSQSPGL